MAMLRAAAAAREAYLLKKAAKAAERFDLAQKARKDGDIRVAARIYMSLISSRSPSEISEMAQQRLTELADEARGKAGDIDARTAAARGKSDWEYQVTAAFHQYDELAEDYGDIPAFKQEIQKHIAQQRRRPDIAVVLNEPEAATLWQLGRQHEDEDHLCCAYWVYEQAARLVPAPSAKSARKRLDEMKQDPEIIAAAKACRQMQECHKTYNLAVRLIEIKPERAKELFATVVLLAPEDSQVHQASRDRLRQMQP